RIVLGVLPFENLLGDPDREYLADSLTEEVIVSLGQVDPDRLAVIGRTSMMTYKRATKSIAEIGRELNATYLVESSLRGEGDRLSGGNSKAISFRGYLLAKLGREGEARDLLRTLEAVSRERYVPPFAMALVHAGLGDRDAVFEWLDKAYAAHDVHLIFLTVDPKWDAYRIDPRFDALLARCGFVAAR